MTHTPHAPRRSTRRQPHDRPGARRAAGPDHGLAHPGRRRPGAHHPAAGLPAARRLHRTRRHHRRPHRQPGRRRDSPPPVAAPTCAPCSPTAAPSSSSPPPRRRPTGGRPRRGATRRGEPPEITDWFGDDLRDPDRPAGTIDDAPPAPRPHRQRAPSLLVAVWPLHARRAGQHRPAHRSDDRRRSQCCDRAAASRSSPPADSGGEYTALVAAARAAGLRYLQHIVAVRADTGADRFVYYATDDDLADARGRGVGHVNIHDRHRRLHRTAAVVADD